MADKEGSIPLSEVLSLDDGKGINKKYVDIILEEDIPVLCIKKDTQKSRLMPFKTLHDNNENFWQIHNETWEYYLTSDDFNKLKEKALVKPNAWSTDIQKPDEKHDEKPDEKDEGLEELDEATEDEIELGFGSEYKAFQEMSAKEQVERLNNDKDRLDKILAEKGTPDTVITEALVETTKSAALINRAALENAIYHADNEAKKLTQGLVDSTCEMVKSSAQLITENIFQNELMNTMVEKSNGTVIQHMTRVFLNGVAFLSYYNKLVSTSSTIQKLRVNFSVKYGQFYHSLLPHINAGDINLEHVFYGGMRAIEPELFLKWAVGFLIHDIGKASAVEYHEGVASYNRDIVIDHVKQGYNYVNAKTNYPKEASLIIGYHHEYYGDPDGYGFFRAYFARYKKDNPAAKQDFCIGYELEPVLDFQVLGYFPAKVLEIIDVFDSLTDPHRVYHHAMTQKDALKLMRDEFINKRHKLDLILFDIFVAFLKEKERDN
ncbi:HD-GYP domain-containing protein [Treponema sp. R80B11-R83G3]